MVKKCSPIRIYNSSEYNGRIVRIVQYDSYTWIDDRDYDRGKNREQDLHFWKSVSWAAIFSVVTHFNFIFRSKSACPHHRFNREIKPKMMCHRLQFSVLVRFDPRSSRRLSIFRIFRLEIFFSSFWTLGFLQRMLKRIFLEFWGRD